MIAALADPWPTAVVRAPDERAAALRVAAIEAVLGELPQAEWIEPFGPGDPAGWEVRIALPGLTGASWAAIGHLAELEPGVPPARGVAEREGRVAADLIEVPGLTLERVAIDGEPAGPELLRREMSDPVLTSLIAAIDRAARELAPAARLVESSPVVDLRSGKVGLELVFDADDSDDLRRALAIAIAAAVAEIGLPVSSIGSWEAPFSAVVWLAVPPVPVLPEGWDSFTGPSDPRIAAFELQVIPTSSPLAAALAVAAMGERGAVELSPSGGRWIAVDGRLSCASCWLAAHRSLPADPAVAEVRWVPIPAFAAEEWRASDVACWVEGGVAFVRVTGADGRDRVERARDEALPDRDGWLLAAKAAGARSVRGIRDDLGEGLEWSFGRASWADLRATLRRVLEFSPGPLATTGTVAHTAEGTIVRVWVAGAVEMQ